MSKFFNILWNIGKAQHKVCLVGPYYCQTDAECTFRQSMTELAKRGVGITPVSKASGLFQTVAISGARVFKTKEFSQAVTFVADPPEKALRCPRCQSPVLGGSSEELTCCDCGHLFSEDEAL